MEQIKTLVLKARNSQSLSLTNSELSVYKGELTDRGIVTAIANIKKSFPSLPLGFYDVFIDRIRENGFTDERLIDAVNSVIDTCIYPTPTIANFISFDRKVKLYSYEDMLRKVNELGYEVWNSYKQVMLPGRKRPVWVHIDEEKYLNL